MLDSQGIIITGSEGLIGSLLVQTLRKKGINVYPIDQRLSETFKGRGNICDKSWLKMQLTNCKGIVHLAAVSRVIWGERNPELCWETNVQATQSLLELASDLPFRPWFIYASSREVYGQQKYLPVTEDTTLQPLNHYAKSKVAAEKLIEIYRHQGLQTAILRFSSVYGSIHDHPDRVIPAFCLNALRHIPLRIEGSNNIFDFTHVNDVVHGIMLCINQLENKNHHLPSLHLTTGKGTSLLNIVELIQTILTKKIAYYEAPKRTYDVHTFYGNSDNAKKYLDWEAKVNLQDGLQDLIQKYQIHLSSGVYS